MAPPFVLRVRSIGIATLLFVALLALPGSAFATRTLGLSAGTFKFTVNAGQQVRGQVIVLNDGTEPLQVMVYASDQKVDARGNVAYTTPTLADLQSRTLPSSWTTIKIPADSKSFGNVPYLELAPHERIPVKFSIIVPPGVAPGDHNVLLFFESFVSPKPGQGPQSMISGRLGSRVTLRVNGQLYRKLDVRPFAVPAYVFGGEIPYDFTVRNGGNVDQRVGARVLLLDRNDNEVTSHTAIDGITVFAGSNLEATGTVLVEKTAVGPFKVRIDVSPVGDDGHATNSGADTITESRTVWLIPWWLVALAVAVALLVFVRIIWVTAARATSRRHKRLDDKSSGAAAPSEHAETRPFPGSEYER